MNKIKKNFILLGVSSILLTSSFLPGFCETGVNPEGTEDNAEVPNYYIMDEDIAFVSRELREKHSREEKELKRKLTKEKKELLDKLKDEEKDLRKRLKKEQNELSDRIRRDREEFERRIKEAEKELEERQRQEVLDEIKANKTKRVYNRRSRNGRALSTKLGRLAEEEKIKERRRQVNTAGRRYKFVDFYTSPEDPLVITEAEVKPSKTEFLSVKDVSLRYRVKLRNQTPKIVNSVSVLWERKVPFSNDTTISRETNISKPIIPYDDRVVEYNENDTKRNGEIYKVFVSKVLFEDGTQWRNPDLIKKSSK